MHQLQVLIEQQVAQGLIPAVSATSINAEGEIWRGAAGLVKPCGAEPMTSNSVVWLASMTKAVTGVALMQLVERLHLDLDTPASEWLPNMARVQVLQGFADNGAPRLRRAASVPTLRQLLTHTSGFGYDMWSDKLFRLGEYQAEYTDWASDFDEVLIFDPGTDWAYGTGIDWCGRVVEEITGRSLGEVLRNQIFEPLKMTDTAFLLSDDMRSKLVPVHVRDEQGGFQPIEFEIEQNPEHEMGGGGLYGTPTDYLQFCRAILRGGELDGERILQATTVATMAANHMGARTMGDLPTSVPSMTNDLAFFPGVEKNWGLTFMRNEQATLHGRAPGTLAWAGLANTYYWIDINGGTAGVWATQLFPFNDSAARECFFEFETAVLKTKARATSG